MSLDSSMRQRLDVFCKESPRLIQWVGTAANCEEAAALIRADCAASSRSEDDYLVVETRVSETFHDTPHKLNVIGL